MPGDKTQGKLERQNKRFDAEKKVFLRKSIMKITKRKEMTGDRMKREDQRFFNPWR